VMGLVDSNSSMDDGLKRPWPIQSLLSLMLGSLMLGSLAPNSLTVSSLVSMLAMTCRYSASLMRPRLILPLNGLWGCSCGLRHFLTSKPPSVAAIPFVY
jgi:hypothetical protein